MSKLQKSGINKPDEQNASGHGTRQGPEEQRLQGHWLLAKLGKKVLRPGGIELTEQMLMAAAPSSQDRIIEFGPGVGRTASMLLAKNPKSYLGVDPNPQGAPAMNALLAGKDQASMVVADAKATSLPAGQADLIVGEAMLTMMNDLDKAATISEAWRLLAPGGRYAVHELGLRPDNLPAEVEAEISKGLSRSIKVGARPLTLKNWIKLLEDAGFEIEDTFTNAMHLLEPKRIVRDEGIRQALRFFLNVIKNRPARRRLLAMRKVFRTHQEHLCAFALVARKKPGF